VDETWVDVMSRHPEILSTGKEGRTYTSSLSTLLGHMRAYPFII
jgi:hypothetical protein